MRMHAIKYLFTIVFRKTRERWALLTVETEANGDSKSTNEKDPSLVGSLGSSCRYNRFLSCLGCSSRLSTKYFFSSPCTNSIHLSPSPTKLDRQSCRGHLSLNLCLSGRILPVYSRNVDYKALPMDGCRYNCIRVP
jgi:hypothetical protein